jgi:hypothetical protein
MLILLSLDKDFTGFQSQADKIEGLFIFNKIK